MKVKTSVSLSEKLLHDIEDVAGSGCNRSAILEEAVREWLAGATHSVGPGARVKTSVSLSEDLLGELDEAIGPGGNRSAVAEEALLAWIRQRRREERDRTDAETYARVAADPRSRREVEQAHSFDVPWWEPGDEVELLPEVEQRIAREEAARAAG